MAEKIDRKVTPPIYMEPADNHRNIWSVEVENHVTPADLRESGFWAHLAQRLAPRDQIEVEPQDGSWHVKLRVSDVGEGYAKVEIMRPDAVGVFKLESPTSAAVPQGYAIEFSGAHTKWRVIRDSDRKMLKDGFSTRVDAIGWAHVHSNSKAQAA